MKTWQIVKAWLEWLGGADELPPVKERWWLGWVLGLWWGFLAVLIACFSGQTSRFLYIDF